MLGRHFRGGVFIFCFFLFCVTFECAVGFEFRDDQHTKRPEHPPFVVNVRHYDDNCTGKVTIRRTSAQTCPPQTIQVSRVDASDQIYKELYGPDAFLVKIEGPEALVVQMWHRGGCVYEGEYQMSLPGPHTLFGWQVYENYIAVTEMHDEGRWWWPVRERRYLWDNRTITERPIVLQCRTPREDASIYEHIYQTQGILGDGQVLPVEKVLELQSKKPPCVNGSQASVGRWTLIEPQTAEKNATYEWNPYTCSIPTLNWDKQKTYNCLRGKFVQIMGDSQHRLMYHAMLNYVREDKVLDNKKFDFDKYNPFNDTTTTIQFNADVYLMEYFDKNIVTNRAGNIDALFLGFGHWPAAASASTGGKWKLYQYKRHLETRGVKLGEYVKKHEKVATWWLGVTPMPFPWRSDSRRSNERLGHANKMAERTMQRNEVDYISPFSIAEGVAQFSTDGSHLTGPGPKAVGAVMLTVLCNKWGRL